MGSQAPAEEEDDDADAEAEAVAKTAAKKAGRRYPNLVDNMREAAKQKRAAKKR